MTDFEIFRGIKLSRFWPKFAKSRKFLAILAKIREIAKVSFTKFSSLKVMLSKKKYVLIIVLVSLFLLKSKHICS